MEANIRVNSAQQRVAYSKVETIARRIPPYECTRFDFSILRRGDFQAHIERLGDFMFPGEGIWWHKEGDEIVMHDGAGYL